MYDTINGAKAAASRLERRLQGSGISLNASTTREIAARAAGYRDWHHLQKDIGTPAAPTVEGMPKAFIDYVAAKMSTPERTVAGFTVPASDVDPKIVYGVLTPKVDHGRDTMKLIPDGRAIKEGVRYRMFSMRGESPRNVVTDGIRTLSFDQRQEYGGPVPRDEKIDIYVRDMQWNMIVEKKHLAVAEGTIHDVNRAYGPDDARLLSMQIHDSSFGNGGVLVHVWKDGAPKGRMLLLTMLEVAQAERGKGHALTLLKHILTDAADPKKPITSIWIDCDHDDVESAGVQLEHYYAAVKAWFARPVVAAILEELAPGASLGFISVRHGHII